MRDIKFKQWNKTDKNWKIYFPKGWLFTGLLDKNGKEIYEGDIVKYNLLNCSITAEVKWEHFGFYFAEKDGGSVPLCNGLDIEVIGNTFENPELLK